MPPKMPEEGKPAEGRPEFGFPELSRSLECLEPIALSEERIQQTLVLAREWRQSRWRRRRRAVQLAAVALFSFTAAAGVWYWSGERSDNLPFGTMIGVIEDADSYEAVSVDAAIGKVWKDMRRLIEALDRGGGLTQEIRDSVVAAIDSAEPEPARYPGGLERVQRDLDAGVSLSAHDRVRLIGMLKAGIYAVRQAGRADPGHGRFADIVTARIRKQLRASPGPERGGSSGGGPKSGAIDGAPGGRSDQIPPEPERDSDRSGRKRI